MTRGKIAELAATAFIALLVVFCCRFEQWDTGLVDVKIPHPHSMILSDRQMPNFQRRADHEAALAALDKLGIASLAGRDSTRISGRQRQLALVAREGIVAALWCRPKCRTDAVGTACRGSRVVAARTH
jgi:hypothetical protein